MELPGVPKTLPAWMLDHNTPPGIAAPPPRGRRFTEQGLLRALLFTPHDLVGRHASGAAMASAASAASVAPAAASPFLPMDVFSPPVAKAFALRHGASFPVDDSLGWLFESCPLRGCVTVVGGFVMGLVFGAAFSGAGMGVVGGVEAPPPPAARPAAAPGAPAPAAAAAAPPAPSGAVARVVQMQAEQAAVLMTPVNNLGGLPISPTIVTPRAGVASVAAMEAAETSALQALKEGFVLMKTRGLATGKNFAIVGGIYSTLECFMEQVRGKKDMTNAVTAGFVTGAALAGRAGPKAMIVGGAGFAAFSVIIEVFMPNMFGGE